MKTFFLALIMTTFLTQPQSQINTATSPKSDHCTMTCTIYVEDGFGGSYGISASAGGWFTNCDEALRKACLKVSEIAFDLLFNLQ